MKKRRVGRCILIGVIVANLNFSSGLVNVKLFCSGCLKVRNIILLDCPPIL